MSKGIQAEHVINLAFQYAKEDFDTCVYPMTVHAVHQHAVGRSDNMGLSMYEALIFITSYKAKYFQKQLQKHESEASND